MTHNDRALCRCGIRIPSARNRCPAFDKDKYLEPMLGEVGQARTNARICSYIPNFGQYKHDREGFTYNKTNDKYTCSQGVDLPFKKIITSRLGYQRKSYRSSALDCARCLLRSQCIGKTDFKKIEDTVNKPLYDRMHVKLQTQKAKRMKKLRSSTVEPVLGTLVNYLGMRRVNTRGIAQANKCMLMAAITDNLKKLLKFTTRKVQTNLAAMQVNLKALFYPKQAFTNQYIFHWCHFV